MALRVNMQFKLRSTLVCISRMTHIACAFVGTEVWGGGGGLTRETTCFIRADTDGHPSPFCPPKVPCIVNVINQEHKRHPSERLPTFSYNVMSGEVRRRRSEGLMGRVGGGEGSGAGGGGGGGGGGREDMAETNIVLQFIFVSVLGTLS